MAAWYDASRTQWLRDGGYLVGEEVLGSVPPTAIDDELRAELLALAVTRWHGAAREIITSAIERKVIFGTPLAEYLPERLVAGRLGIVGDVAHVAPDQSVVKANGFIIFLFYSNLLMGEYTRSGVARGLPQIAARVTAVMLREQCDIGSYTRCSTLLPHPRTSRGQSNVRYRDI